MFLEQTLSTNGLRLDPHWVTRVYNFPEPNNITETRRFLAMVNQMGKFIPNLTEMTKPLWSRDSEECVCMG